MKLRALFILVITIFPLFAVSQKVSGIIVDHEKNPVEYATVILLASVDSTMISFSNSNRKGEFSLSAKKSGTYILQVSFLGYETVNMPVVLKNEDLSTETIALKPGTKLLDVIEIKDYASPMSFGKDTLQYNAAAFKIQPGDMVEDLLKKLPGVEVQRDGSVKALGENVKNVLVDGKEFFGKDTKIATKNLDADAVDKVQVFDRKSDNTEFTGIDDGSRERSINLKLKEDKKVGYFGTAEAFAGTKDRFKSRTNVNRFRPGLRTSFIGMANNINEQNFSFNEYIDFMGGIGALMGGGGGGRFTLNMDEMGGLPISPLTNSGIQKSVAGGINLSKDFSSSTSLECSVFGNHFDNSLLSSSTRENLLPERKFYTLSDENQQSDNTSGSFTVRFKTKPDSSQNLVIRANGSLGTNDLLSREKNALQNSLRINQNDNINEFIRSGSNHNLSTNILWQIKTRKPGRTFSLSGSGGFSNSNSNADLNSLYNFYYPQSNTNRIIQNQIGKNDGINYRGEISWTEPIRKKRYLELKSSIANLTNKTSSDYFDIINENPVRNILLSNHFQRDYIQRNAGANLIFNGEKYNLTLGTRYKYSTLTGTINENTEKTRNNFNAVLPNAFFTYRFGLSENLNFNYFSELNEPSLQQLQPAVNNTNPLSVYIGNPELQPEQMHNMNLSYMRYDAFNFTMLYVNLQTNYTHNKISEALSIDSSLVRSYTPQNIDREYTTSGRIEFETPIRPLKVKARLTLKGSLNQGYSIINEMANDIKRNTYGYNFTIENRNKDVVDIIAGYKTSTSNSVFSQNAALNQSYDEKTFFTELGINIKDWINIKSRYDLMTIKPSFASSSNSFPLWTASITSYTSKTKKLRVTLSCFDILNQNQGIRTSTNLNYTDLTLSNVLSRYFLIGLSYNLKGFQKRSGVEIKVESTRE